MSLKYEEKNETTNYAISEKKCDGCDRIAKHSDLDRGEWLGFEHFNFGAEYSLIFDDSMHCELDLCRHCMKKIFENLLKDTRKKVLKKAKNRCKCIHPILLGPEDVPSIPKGYGRCQICREFVKCG